MRHLLLLCFVLGCVHFGMPGWEALLLLSSLLLGLMILNLTQLLLLALAQLLQIYEEIHASNEPRLHVVPDVDA